MKAIKQAKTRSIIDSYNKEEISYSRMNEMFNELADQFALGFADYCLMIFGRLRDNEITIDEALQIYKTKTS